MTKTAYQSYIYHGAACTDIDRLLQLQELADGPIGWLGTGVYFWDGSDYAAQQWALEKSNDAADVPAVGQLKLALKENDWVDFTDPRMRAEFIEFSTEYEYYLGEAGLSLKAEWEAICDQEAVSKWGFWMNLWLKWFDRIMRRETIAIRAIVPHQDFTFTRSVPRLEGHAVPSMKGYPRVKRSRDDASNSVRINDRARPRYPDVGIAWVVRCPKLLAKVKRVAP